MNHREYFIMLADYNAWANRRLVAALEALGDDAWYADHGLFFRSIHGTFNHILLVERLWLGRLTGRPAGIRTLDQPLAEARTELCEELFRQNELTRGIMAELPDPLPPRLRYTTIDGAPMDMPFQPLLAHVFNHATHHRGQITAAAHRLGLRVQELDIPYFLRDRAL